MIRLTVQLVLARTSTTWERWVLSSVSPMSTTHDSSHGKHKQQPHSHHFLKNYKIYKYNFYYRYTLHRNKHLDRYHNQNKVHITNTQYITTILIRIFLISFSVFFGIIVRIGVIVISLAIRNIIDSTSWRRNFRCTLYINNDSRNVLKVHAEIDKKWSIG